MKLEFISIKWKWNFVNKLEEKKIEEKVFKKALNYLSIYISSTKKLTIILEKFTKNKFPKLDKLKNIKVAYQGCAEGKYCYPKIVKSL